MRVRGKLPTNETLTDVIIRAGRIDAVLPADLAVPCDAGGAAQWLAPGWLDIQVNGFAGTDFNNAQTSAQAIAVAFERLRATGVTGLLPTIITGAHEHITACLRNLVQAAEIDGYVAQMLIGFHLEGPFISAEDGPRGAHPREHVRPPDWEEFQRWQDAARGQIRLLTLAPEQPGTLAFIERATAAGIVIALGHTAATPSQIRDAVQAGAQLSTHLGNGSHAQLARHPNYIWEQLAADELMASFIVDGHHLPPAVVKCFLRSKGMARSILTTDAIAAAGCPPGRYQLGATLVEVTPQGRVCLPGTPYLAGSAAQMHELIGNTVRFSDATLGDAIALASTNPARLLGLPERGALAVGQRADLILFDWDEQAYVVKVRRTFLDGEA